VDSLLRALPKAELHLHIEGTLEPRMMLELARRNRLTMPFATEDELRAAYSFTDLQSFLDLYYQGADVLVTEQDFHDLAAAYLARAAADGVVRTEIFFDPQTHTARGVPIGVVIEGLASAVDRAGDQGLSAGLIMCFVRHLPEREAQRTLEQAGPYLDRIIGVGLDSSEAGHPPSQFVRVFEEARRAGLHVVAHAGEEGPPDYVRQALDLLGAERIDHGVRVLEDPELTRRLAAEGVPLTVCPLSNVALRVVDDLGHHMLPAMIEAGLTVSVNSDPAYFGGYIGDNYRAVATELGLGDDVMRTIARNSLESAFLEPEELERLSRGTAGAHGNVRSGRAQHLIDPE
jgi:adenosine deaminase